MKYIPSIAFEEMSGSAKGVTAAKVRGHKYIRNRGYGGGFKSSAQGAVPSSSSSARTGGRSPMPKSSPGMPSQAPRRERACSELLPRFPGRTSIRG